MNCRDTKHLLALHLGHDTHDREELRDVKEHLAGCQSCRIHAQRLKVSLNQLQHLDEGDTFEPVGSLWPEVESRLNQLSQRRAPAQRAWLPVVSVAAACLFAVGLWTAQPHSGAHDPALRSQPRQMIHTIPVLQGDPRRPAPRVDQPQPLPAGVPSNM